jgi:hypothetical protein
MREDLPGRYDLDRTAGPEDWPGRREDPRREDPREYEADDAEEATAREYAALAQVNQLRYFHRWARTVAGVALLWMALTIPAHAWPRHWAAACAASGADVLSTVWATGRGAHEIGLFGNPDGSVRWKTVLPLKAGVCVPLAGHYLFGWRLESKFWKSLGYGLGVTETSLAANNVRIGIKAGRRKTTR